MSEASSSRQVIHARRPRLDPEVIDVDALPGDEVHFTRVRSNPAQRRRISPRASTSPSNTREQPIVVYDSDEEVAQELAGHSGVVRRARPLVRQPSYRDVTRVRHNEPPPAIVANARPLPFEAQMNRPTRRSAAPAPAPVPAHAVEAAPRSHHQPAMGLGGAIIAMNRQNALENAHRRRHHQQPLPLARQTHVYGLEPAEPQVQSWAGSLVNTLRNFFGHSGRRQEDGENTWTSYLDDPWVDFDDAEDEALWGNVHAISQPKPMASAYQPSFTHPGSPPPGFTHSFGESETVPGVSGKPVIVLDDDVASNPSQSSSTLVCARCMDPLVLPAEDSSADENKQRRVWALRCGHMLDGKCIAELMRPRAEASEPVAVRLNEDVSMDSLSADTQSGREDGAFAPPQAIVDRKGKGKAVDRGLPAFDGPRDPPMHRVRPLKPLDDDSIRSRLRPRRTGATAPPAPRGTEEADETRMHVDEEENDESYPDRPTRPLPRRARGALGNARPRAKGKARKRNERFHWKCPVSDCGHDHISTLAPGEDEYRMDPHKGAIALFL
ncbi:hypothetical protein PHLGIDRAFT_127270 [Phlebiopsis gigantea 11061_1 CR5-6]|uniref:Uncharacterized protein n=1 Tax=Phlebiopsis gigantea (strain 11061_1 CR5-6) TaxID=745531 RepID=A0A0C3SBJ5_PHLG1|nr:hypothetical protein PHLGIDRAFT_127270 [Phlebiopsis gigantea 11061_1 CR5-6]